MIYVCDIYMYQTYTNIRMCICASFGLMGKCWFGGVLNMPTFGSRCLANLLQRLDV